VAIVVGSMFSSWTMGSWDSQALKLSFSTVSSTKDGDAGIYKDGMMICVDAVLVVKSNMINDGWMDDQ